MRGLSCSDPPFQHPLILAAQSCAPARLQSRARRRPLSKLSTAAHTDFSSCDDQPLHILYQSLYTSALQGAHSILDVGIGGREYKGVSSECVFQSLQQPASPKARPARDLKVVYLPLSPLLPLNSRISVDGGAIRTTVTTTAVSTCIYNGSRPTIHFVYERCKLPP
jgi:hypothetical protein